MYTIKEEREIQPETLARLLSSTLYERRWAPLPVETVIAGLETTPTGKLEPFLASADDIGGLIITKDFVVIGSARQKLAKAARCMWQPDLEPEDLFETISQTLMDAIGRDALAGRGAVVHVMCVMAYISFFVRRC